VTGKSESDLEQQTFRYLLPTQQRRSADWHFRLKRRKFLHRETLLNFVRRGMDRPVYRPF